MINNAKMDRTPKVIKIPAARSIGSNQRYHFGFFVTVDVSSRMSEVALADPNVSEVENPREN